jgi:hypothetical protein
MQMMNASSCSPCPSCSSSPSPSSHSHTLVPALALALALACSSRISASYDTRWETDDEEYGKWMFSTQCALTCAPPKPLLCKTHPKEQEGPGADSRVAAVFEAVVVAVAVAVEARSGPLSVHMIVKAMKSTLVGQGSEEEGRVLRGTWVETRASQEMAMMLMVIVTVIVTVIVIVIVIMIVVIVMMIETAT